MKFSSESADEFIFKYYPFQVNFPWYFLRDMEVIVKIKVPMSDLSLWKLNAERTRKCW